MALSPQEFEKLKLQLARRKEPLSAPSQTGFTASVKDIPSDIVGTFKGVVDAVAGGINAARDVQERVAKGETTPLAGTKQVIGAGLRAGAEVVGEGVLAIPKLLTSPGAERKVEEVVTKGAEAVVKSDPAQYLLSKYNALSEEQKRNVDANLGIAEGFATLLGAAPAVKATKAAIKPVLKASENLANKAKTGVSEGFDMATSLVRPTTERTLDSTLAQVREVPRKANVVTAALEGRATQTGKLKSFEVAPSEREIEMAKDVMSVTGNRNGNIVETLADLKTATKDISENQLRPYLQQNPRTFRTAQINSKLEAIEMPDLFKTDDSLGKTYNLVRGRMIEAIERNPHTMEGLWDARKEFDRIVKDQFGDAAFDSEKNTAIKRAIQDMRRAVNDYIGEQIGDDTFKKQMRKMSNLYEAQYNLAERFYSLQNSNALIRWAKENPAQAKALGIVGSTIGVGALGTVVFQ